MNLPYPRVEAAAVILIQHGKMLITERPAYKKIMAGYWEFPGGKIEEGETPELCMVREAQEELGITPKNYTFLGTIQEHRNTKTLTPYTVYVHVYSCTSWEGTITALEQQQMQWTTISGLHEVNLLPANYHLIPWLEELFLQPHQ